MDVDEVLAGPSRANEPSCSSGCSREPREESPTSRSESACSRSRRAGGTPRARPGVPAPDPVRGLAGPPLWRWQWVGATMASMLAAFSITPLGTGESVGAEVAEAVRIVRESGLPNETNAMFTNLEGSWDEVMGVIGRCVDALAERAPRLSVVVKLDIRPGQPDDRMAAKVASVEDRLG